MEFSQALAEEQGVMAQLLRAAFPAQPEELTSRAFLRWMMLVGFGAGYSSGATLVRWPMGEV